MATEPASPPKAVPPPYSASGLYILALGQTICWTGLYYSFAALLFAWERQLGWSKTDLTLGLTLAVLIAALVAPLAGRVTDRAGGRWMLTVGALTGAAALAALASTTTHAGFLLAWCAIGFTQGLCLYEPCFAYLTHVLGASAQHAILRLALVAGFASPLSFITGTHLADWYNWQTAILVYAAALACLGAPLHFLGATLLERRASTTPEAASLGVIEPATTSTGLAIAIRKPAFWWMVLGFPLIALNHGMLINHIIPLLAERGVATTTAVAAASLVGPMQVVGRLMVYQFEDRVSMLTVTFISAGGLIAASLLLLIAGAGTGLVIAFAATQGAAYGLVSVLRPGVIAETLGRNAFGVIAGWLAVPYLVAYAAAPYLGALLWNIGTYDLMIYAALFCGIVGLLTFLALRQNAMPQNEPPHV